MIAWRPFRSARQQGFTLLSVLIAMLILGFGLLAIGKTYATLTGGSTQNQNISALAALSNGFWGAVQASPNMLTDSPSVVGSFTSANKASAPVGLQPWLQQVFDFIPDATVVIATGPDVVSGQACAASTGCAVSLSVRWSQLVSAGGVAVPRQQDFFYQFGL